MDGKWKSGKLHGKAETNWADGRKLVGIFKEGGFWKGKEYNRFGKIVGNYIKGVFQGK